MNFKQISFKKAMKMVANGDLENLYFNRNDSIVCAKSYQMSITALAKQKWFKREVIE